MKTIPPEYANLTDLLKHCYRDQRDELSFRRNREFQIFGWSTTLLIAIIGALIVNGRDHILIVSKYGPVGKIEVSLVVVLLTFFSVMWQRDQRKYAALNQRVLAKIAVKLGCFDPILYDDKESLYPKDWEEWGAKSRTATKTWATVLLGILAFITVWLP